MFEPFPGNYVWNLSANLALYTGGNHGKVDMACRRARGAAEQGADAGTGVFFDSFLKVADQVDANAERDVSTVSSRRTNIAKSIMARSSATISPTGLPRTSGCQPADQIKEYFQSGLSK